MTGGPRIVLPPSAPRIERPDRPVVFAIGAAGLVLLGLEALVRPWTQWHLVAGGLGLAVIGAAALSIRRQRIRLEIAALALLALQLGWFLATVAGASAIERFRLVQMAAIVAVVAILLAGGLVRLASIGMRPAFVVGGAIALGFAGADFVIGLDTPAVRPMPRRPWPSAFVPHPELSWVPPASTEYRVYYPDDRLGYLEQEDERTATWHLQVMPGSEASLAPATDPRLFRVAIERANRDTTWHVQLSQSRFAVVRGKPYSIAFRARADQPRTIAVGFGRNHPPYTTLGLYQPIKLTPTWQSFREFLLASGSDHDARIFFDLAGEESSVEIDSVAMFAPPSRDQVEPIYPAGRYFVRFRTNAHRCRDRDYPEARPANTVRILLLGDGFTAGDGVHERDTFARLAEERLNSVGSDSAAQRFQLINCGVKEFGSREQRVIHQELDDAYRPDVIVITAGFNDDAWYAEQADRHLLERGLGRLARLSAIVRRATATSTRRHDYRPVADDLIAIGEKARARGGRLMVAVSRHGPVDAGDSLLAVVRRSLGPSAIPILDLGRPAPDTTELPLPNPGPRAHREAAAALSRWLAGLAANDHGEGTAR